MAENLLVPDGRLVIIVTSTPFGENTWNPMIRVCENEKK